MRATILSMIAKGYIMAEYYLGGVPYFYYLIIYACLCN